MIRNVYDTQSKEKVEDTEKWFNNPNKGTEEDKKELKMIANPEQAEMVVLFKEYS